MAIQSDDPGVPERRPFVADQVWAHDFARQIMVLFADHAADALSPQVWEEMRERAEAARAGSTRGLDDPFTRGRARKVSVSMPEELTAAVQRRVGKGEFSRYVTEAVARRYEQDLVADLAGLLEAEHGPVPAELLAEAAAAWPDAD
jgi:hypothetical protein